MEFNSLHIVIKLINNASDELLVGLATAFRSGNPRL